MKIWKYTFLFLILIAIFVWGIALTRETKNVFKIIACDVGQGDAILITFGETQILTDGGPGSKVISCLEKYMPILDRTIELVVLSNPDKDHYAGLIEVFKRYEVNTLLANSFDKSGQEYQVLKSHVGGSGTEVIYPEEGTVVRLGLISLDILWPTDSYYSSKEIDKNTKKILGASTVKDNPNDLSIVTVLKFGEFEALLTGDIEQKSSDIVANKILTNYPNTIFEYIKVPHHGSKNGLTKKLLDAVSPEVSVISNGRDNSYGHPHQSVLDMLSASGVQIQRTDIAGEIVVEVNESSWLIKE